MDTLRIFDRRLTPRNALTCSLRPREVILIDCPLEYKKNESNTNVEITNEADWEAMLMQEEEEARTSFRCL